MPAEVHVQPRRAALGRLMLAATLITAACALLPAQADAVVLRNLDFQTPGLLKPGGRVGQRRAPPSGHPHVPLGAAGGLAWQELLPHSEAPVVRLVRWRPVTLALAAVAFVVLPPPLGATVLRELDRRHHRVPKDQRRPWQWDNYVPNDGPTSGIELGSPGVLPPGYLRAARFQPANASGRPRSQAKLSKDSKADPGVPLRGPLDAAEGLDRWYLWYVYFPQDFDIPASAPTGASTVIQAWHADASQSPLCNPNVQIHAKRVASIGEPIHILIRVRGGLHADHQPTGWTPQGTNADGCFVQNDQEVDLGPLVRGRWIQFGMHIHWSSRPSQGLVQVWRDGQPVAQITSANLYRSNTGVPEQGYLEEGIYIPNESDASARTRTVWQVGMRIASDASDVVPLLGPVPQLPVPSTPSPPPPKRRRPGLVLRTSCYAHGLRASVSGRRVKAIRSVTFIALHRKARDRHRPFRHHWVLRRGRHRRITVVAKIYPRHGHSHKLRARSPACRVRRSR